MNYCSDNNAGIAEALDNPNVRRRYAIKYVKEGIIQGCLAYYDGKIAGWCNTNDRNSCLTCFGWHFITGNKKVN